MWHHWWCLNMSEPCPTPTIGSSLVLKQILSGWASWHVRNWTSRPNLSGLIVTPLLWHGLVEFPQYIHNLSETGSVCLKAWATNWTNKSVRECSHVNWLVIISIQHHKNDNKWMAQWYLQSDQSHQIPNLFDFSHFSWWQSNHVQILQGIFKLHGMA